MDSAQFTDVRKSCEEPLISTSRKDMAFKTVDIQFNSRRKMILGPFTEER